jgi:outer membrane immunogenic protein
VYGTGGLAYGKAKLDFETVDVDQGCVPFALCASGASSGIRSGWTAGGGIETLLTPNWGFKAEYLYIDLGRTSLSMVASTAPILFETSAEFREHIVRIGINYHFH